MKPMRPMRKLRGVTLIEILVALAIGLVVVAAVMVSFIGSGQAGRTQSAMSQMNQDAQVGLNLLSREVQLAGYSGPAALTNTNAAVVPAVPANWVVSYHNLTGALGYVNATTNYIFGCDSGTAGIGPFANPTADPLVCAVASGATSSGLSVVYEADIKNTVPDGGVPTDCLGTALPARLGGNGETYYVARNRYFIDKSTGANASGRPELYCVSPNSGGGKQPLLENIDDMQIWYGLSLSNIDATAGSRQVVRYVKAADIAVADWDKVMSVRICLLVRSAEQVLRGTDNDSLTYTYQPCNSNDDKVTTTDGYMRRAYYTTSTLRSKMTY